MDRLAEVHGETLFHSFIYDHTEQKMFAVFYRGEVATCFTKARSSLSVCPSAYTTISKW